MAVYLPAYCTREDVKSASDILQTADYDAHVDSAIQAARADIDRLCKRRFYNVDETNYWDWPNFQRAYPWRIWFDAAELADTTVNVPAVYTGVAGGTLPGALIPASAIFWGPVNYAPPYTFLELNRSLSYAFGTGPTPQRDVSITGTFGYWIQSRPAGVLAASASSSATTITVSNSAVIGVGDTITIGSPYERMLVSDRTFADTGQAQTGSGCTTALSNDNILAVGDGADINAGELLQLDAEVMLATSVTGNNVTVIRSYDGSVLAEHSGAEVYAARLLTVLRGQFGTTAASQSESAAITALLVPGQVRELAIAESLNYVAQKSAAYARTLATGSSSPTSTGTSATGASAVPGGGLPDLRNRVYEAFGRKARRRVI
jgi:hypothetical protein